MRSSTASYLFAFLFFLFMLFVSGGILETYRQDRRLNTGDFFAASGRILLAFRAADAAIDYPLHHCWLQSIRVSISWRTTLETRQSPIRLASSSGSPRMIVFLLLALALRLWFDVAQVRAVAQNQRGMWRNTWRAFSITASDLPSSVLDVFPHQPVRVDHSRHRARDLGQAAANSDACNVCSAGTDPSGAVAARLWQLASASVLVQSVRRTDSG